MTDKPDFWSVRELAERAGVSGAYVRQLLLAGKLKGTKFANAWAIPNDEAVRFLVSRATKEGQKVQKPLDLGETSS